MSSSPGERGKTLQGIVQSLHHSEEMEAWGLMVEAAEEFQRTARKFKYAASTECACFTAEEKDLFSKIARGLQFKSKALQAYRDLSSVQEPSSKSAVDVKQIRSAVEGLLEGSVSAATMEAALEEALPEDCLSEQPLTSPTAINQQQQELHFLTLPGDEALTKATVGKGGTLLERTDMLPGYSYLSILVDKIGLKEPQAYTDPFITISVKTLMGQDVEPVQMTPVSSEKESSYVVFGVPVHIQNPVEDIPGGSAIFFEFKHYKAKKKMTSTKCFSFMEMDEIKPGRAFLEIYKKPTDFRRRKLSLLSIKPLYLHVTLSLSKS